MNRNNEEFQIQIRKNHRKEKKKPSFHIQPGKKKEWSESDVDLNGTHDHDEKHSTEECNAFR